MKTRPRHEAIIAAACALAAIALLALAPTSAEAARRHHRYVVVHRTVYPHRVVVHRTYRVVRYPHYRVVRQWEQTPAWYRTHRYTPLHRRYYRHVYRHDNGWHRGW